MVYHWNKLQQITKTPDVATDFPDIWIQKQDAIRKFKEHMNNAVRILVRDGKAKDIKEAVDIFYNDVKGEAQHLTKHDILEYLDTANIKKKITEGDIE